MKIETRQLEVTLPDSNRKDEIVRVLGHATFPVRSAAPINARLNSKPPGAPATGEVFIVDLDRTDNDGLPVIDLPAIEEYLAEKFGMNPLHVSRFIHRQGLPVLAVGCATNFERKLAVDPGFFASVWV